ncbi:MAG: sterol desaturase, partial [Bacteroidota bacterium]
MDGLFQRWLGISEYITIRYFLIAGTAFVLFYVLLKPWVQIRRIQKRFPKAKHYWRDIFFSLITVVIFATIALLVIVVWFPYTNLYLDIGEYGWGYYGFTYVWMLVLHDTYFYWMHRLM